MARKDISRVPLDSCRKFNPNWGQKPTKTAKTASKKTQPMKAVIKNVMKKKSRRLVKILQINRFHGIPDNETHNPNKFCGMRRVIYRRTGRVAISCFSYGVLIVTQFDL